jgi:hypothetical protein
VIYMPTDPIPPALPLEIVKDIAASKAIEQIDSVGWPLYIVALHRAVKEGQGSIYSPGRLLVQFKLDEKPWLRGWIMLRDADRVTIIYDGSRR